jgi:hypothetical protein
MSKENPFELLQWLGIPAKQEGKNRVATVGLWNWQDLAKKYGRGASVADSSKMVTWADIAQKYNGEVPTTQVVFEKDGRSDWYYREASQGHLGVISAISGAPDVRNFLQRCGMDSKEIVNAVKIYADQGLPPAKILEKLNTEALPVTYWEGDRLKAVGIKSLSPVPKTPGVISVGMGADAWEMRGLHNEPSFLKAFSATLSTNKRTALYGWQTSEGALQLETAEPKNRAGFMLCTRKPREPLSLMCPEDGSQGNRVIVTDGVWNTVAARQLYPHASILSMSGVHSYRSAVDTLLAEREKQGKSLTIRLALDNDAPGQRIARGLAQELVVRGITTPDKLTEHKFTGNDKSLSDVVLNSNGLSVARQRNNMDRGD